MRHSHGLQVTHLHELKVGKLVTRGKVMLLHRINDPLIKFSKQKAVEKTNTALARNVKSVDTYANGTTGYVIKNGSGKGKVKAHLAPNRFQ